MRDSKQTTDMPKFYLSMQEVEEFLKQHRKPTTEYELELPPAAGMKRCTRCKEWKDLSKFSVRRASPDGRNYRCIECDHEYKIERKRRQIHEDTTLSI